MGKLFSADPITKLSRTFHGSDDGNSFFIESQQDVTDIVEFAKAHYNTKDERAPWKGDWHHVGWIPMSTLYQMQAMCRGDEEAMQKAMNIWLNNPENRNLRSRPGRV